MSNELDVPDTCECCGEPVRLMWEDRFCSSRCRRGRCGHRAEMQESGGDRA